MPAPTVAVVGMSALRRDVTRMTAQGGALNAALVKAGLAAVAPVADAARASIPQVSGRLAADVRTSATKTGGAVRMGRASLRYAGWVEFGGHRKAPHPSTRQFEPRGRYLFPAALTLATAVANRYDQAVTQALNSFQWTNETTDAAGVHD